MEKRRERGVLLDFCPPCRGIWLDGGELEALRAGRASPARELDAQAEAEDDLEQRRAVTVLGLCPRCQRALETETLGGVEVDRCGRCGGIYFDAGELPVVLRNQRPGLLRRLFARARGR